MKNIFILSVVLMLALSALCQTPTNPVAAVNPNSASLPAAIRSLSSDMFSDLRNSASISESEWLQLQGDLDYALAGGAACAEDTFSSIARTKDAAFRALSLKAEYYKKYRDFHAADFKRFSQIAAGRMALRQDIESTLANAQQQASDVQRRRMQLQAASRDSGKSAEESVKVLDQMVIEFGTKAENTRAALKRWDDAQGYTAESRRLAAEAEDAVRRLQEVLESESLLWQSYYDAYEARQHLSCQRTRQESMRPFANRRPE